MMIARNARGSTRFVNTLHTTTPAHRSLVHPDLSTLPLQRRPTGNLGHLKRTVRSRRRRSPHTGAYPSLNEGIAPLSRGLRC